MTLCWPDCSERRLSYDLDPPPQLETQELSVLQAYEFTDTLIMILKKNERQITFLHIYHHATTFFPCW